MDLANKIQLIPYTILNVPLQTYCNDFSFIVNGQEIKTTRLISDLLSPKISQIHHNDPTFNQITINTCQPGDFSHILNLINFQENTFPDDELPFIIEVIEQLGNNNIHIKSKFQTEEITEDNVFTLLLQHEKSIQFFSEQYQNEINFISSHMSDFIDTKKNELQKLSENTLIQILDNDQLKLNDEDQLLAFLIDLYSSSHSKYSIYFEYVIFENATSQTMIEFLDNYNINDITNETWRNLSGRLQRDLKPIRENNEKRYKQRGKKFVKKNDQTEFSGIFNYLQNQTKNKIEDEITITSSTIFSNNERYHPRNVTVYNDKGQYFESANGQNNWICFEFKNHFVIPTDYSIRSVNISTDNHPKSWAIECSCDGGSWEVVDEITDCSYLNGPFQFHTFKIKNQQNKEFRFIRLRQTGPNWVNQYYLKIDSFEIYGTLI